MLKTDTRNVPLSYTHLKKSGWVWSKAPWAGSYASALTPPTPPPTWLWRNPLVFTSRHCTESSPRLQGVGVGGDAALKASGSQWMEENAKVSTHQLIIHDAFKACAAARARRHGNCRVSRHAAAAGAPTLWAATLPALAERQASRLQWRGVGVWGRDGGGSPPPPPRGAWFLPAEGTPPFFLSCEGSWKSGEQTMQRWAQQNAPLFWKGQSKIN